MAARPSAAKKSDKSFSTQRSMSGFRTVDPLAYDSPDRPMRRVRERGIRPTTSTTSPSMEASVHKRDADNFTAYEDGEKKAVVARLLGNWTTLKESELEEL